MHHSQLKKTRLVDPSGTASSAAVAEAAAAVASAVPVERAELVPPAEEPIEGAPGGAAAAITSAAAAAGATTSMAPPPEAVTELTEVRTYSCIGSSNVLCLLESMHRIYLWFLFFLPKTSMLLTFAAVCAR